MIVPMKFIKVYKEYYTIISYEFSVLSTLKLDGSTPVTEAILLIY